MCKFKILSLMLAAGLFVGCHNGNSDSEFDIDLVHNHASAQGYDSTARVPVLTFDSEAHDFGRLTEGESISYSFHFKNTGNADLIISGCTATCGCTVADYPRGRIAPGEEGYVTVSFRSQGKSGQQFQEVTVASNAQPNKTKLKIMAQVGRGRM